MELLFNVKVLLTPQKKISPFCRLVGGSMTSALGFG